MKYPLILLLLSMLILAGCTSESVTEIVTNLPEGDVERGALLHEGSVLGAPTCASCHLLTEDDLAGPGFAGYADIAGTRVEGQSAEVYTYNAIIRPADHIVSGYANLMYTQYGTKLSDQDVADLIAFLLTQ